jgi:hypothetical protein
MRAMGSEVAGCLFKSPPSPVYGSRHLVIKPGGESTEDVSSLKWPLGRVQNNERFRNCVEKELTAVFFIQGLNKERVCSAFASR